MFITRFAPSPTGRLHLGHAYSAVQGHARAQYNLGACYAIGTGVAKDEAKAAELYTKAADHGHAGAQHNLTRFYKRGVGGTKDETKAV